MGGFAGNVSRQSTSLEFSLDDSTGRIQVRYYASENDILLPGIESGRYVCIAGMLRTSPEAHVTVTVARFVQSADEISYHIIEASHAALKLKRGGSEPILLTPAPKHPSQNSLQDSPAKTSPHGAVTTS